MAGINVYDRDSLMATPTSKSNSGDQKACKKKNLPWLFGADRKNLSLGITVWHHLAISSLVMPNSDPQTDFSIRTSHPWKILFLQPDKVFRDFHQCWQILPYIPLSDPWDNTLVDRRSCNSVVKALRVDVTHEVNFQHGIRQHIGTWLVNEDSYVKIKCWRSKGMQEKESIMAVWCRQKILSLGITVWHHSAKPHDAKQWPLDGIFYPHLTPTWKILIFYPMSYYMDLHTYGLNSEL